MNMQGFVNSVSHFVQLNPLAAASAVIVLAFLLLWRPKIILILVGGVIAFFGVLFLFVRLADTTGLRHVKIPFLD